MEKRARVILAGVVLAGLATALPSARAADRASSDSRPALWVYAPCNFQVDQDIDRLLALLKRAKKAGYTAAAVTDYKFGHMNDRPANYYANLRRTARTAQDLGIEIIPFIGSFGYSNDLLQNNPDLAEGIEVRDCPFRVEAGRAQVADSPNLLPGGDFEHFRRANEPAGFDYVDGPGQTAFADAEARHGGKTCLRLQHAAGKEPANLRIITKVAVKPHQQYHLAVWLRTRDVEPIGELHINILGPDGRMLNFSNVEAKPTQEWTQHHAVFNSQGYDSITVLVGTWGCRQGTFWLDDLELRQVAGVNLLRRKGCPVRVTSADGATEYSEGKDFRRWEDPRMGHVPYEGAYEVYHAGPPLVLTEGSRIQNGQQLKVSFYHTQTIYEGAVCCCLSHDEVFHYLEKTAQQLETYFHPRRLFLVHDEIRLANQCALCRSRNLTAGELLADNTRRCLKILHRVSPQAEIIDWSDMFDPNHNAVDNYYLVHRTLEKSWEGLDPSVIVANWNSGKAAKSLRFFADRGHRQVIAGYYDTDNVKAEAQGWLDAARGVRRIEGFMYTTWRNDYKDLEKYADAVRGR